MRDLINEIRLRVNLIHLQAVLAILRSGSSTPRLAVVVEMLFRPFVTYRDGGV